VESPYEGDSERNTSKQTAEEWECAAAFPAGASTLRDLRPLLALAIPPPSSDTLIIYTINSRNNEISTNPRY